MSSLFWLLPLCLATGSAADVVHGLWVWKSQSVLEAPNSARALRQFCEAQNINDVYVSVAAEPPPSPFPVHRV